MRRSLLAALALFPLVASTAHAWTWPVDGPVLSTFAFDPAHPYAAGERRGIEVGAHDGAAVAAPAAGTVSFAGTVPDSGRSVTIETPDGYSVTLTQLRSLAVVKGAAVAEGDRVATAAGSVHLGIRVTANAQGYVDPLSFLPPLQVDAGAPPDPAPQPEPVAPPAPASADPTAPAPAPAPAAPAPDPPAADVAPVTEPAVDVPGVVVVASPASRPGLVVRPRPSPSVHAGRSVRRHEPVRSHARLVRPVTPPASLPANTGVLRRELPRDPVAAVPRLRARRFPLVLVALSALLSLATLAIVAILVRMIWSPSRPPVERGAHAVPDPEEDPRRRRVAVRERSAAPRPCRRPGRPVRHLRALPPAARQRRADGQWYRRARHPGDGLRRPRGRVPA
jgi:Peptidase family M23